MFLLKEIKPRHLRLRSTKMFLSDIEQLHILVSATTLCVSSFAFGLQVGIPIGTTSFPGELKLSSTTSGVKM